MWIERAQIFEYAVRGSTGLRIRITINIFPLSGPVREYSQAKALNQSIIACAALYRCVDVAGDPSWLRRA